MPQAWCICVALRHKQRLKNHLQHFSFLNIFQSFPYPRIISLIGFPPLTIGSTSSSVAIRNSITVGASVCAFAQANASFISSSDLTPDKLYEQIEIAYGINYKSKKRG